MKSYEYKLGRFKYYARTAKGEDTFNPYDENTPEHVEWHEGYTEALYEQSRTYLAMSVENLTIFFDIKPIDLLDGQEYKMKKELKTKLNIKYPERDKEKKKKI